MAVSRQHTSAGSAADIRVPERSLELLRDLVAAKTGLYYDEASLHFLRDRLVPLAVNRGFDSLLDFYYLLRYDADAPAEWVRAIDALSVRETYFWRESDQLDALVTHIMPAVAARRPASIRLWSMPCASGEEPLSIAMALDEAGWFQRADIALHASDASEAALERARSGLYRERSFRQLSPARRERYFTATPSGEWAVNPDLHARVASWTRVNAAQPESWGREADADIVFCRNLFIYFQPATVQSVAQALAARMRTPGYLCIAAAESLLRLATPFSLQTMGDAFVYLKA